MDPRTLSGTAPVVEAQEGAEAEGRLVRGSIPLALAAAALFSFSAYASSLEGMGAVRPTLALVAPALALAAILAAVLLPRRGAVAALALLLVPSSIGASLGALSGGSLLGLGVSAAACFLVGEIAAAAAVGLGRKELAGPAALLCPVGVAPALAVVADLGLLGGGLSALPWGIGAGALVADVLLVGARLGEQAAPYRHASSQRVHAALSRWIEVPRSLVLFVVRSFAGGPP